MFIYELLIAITVKTLSFRENRKKSILTIHMTHDVMKIRNLAFEDNRNFSDTPN